MNELDYRAETCSSPIGETGDYDSWIELVTPDFNMQCYDPDVELEQVQELANMLNLAKNCNIHDVSGSLPSDKEVEDWFDLNIDNDSASSAIYKFRLWLEERWRQ